MVYDCFTFFNELDLLEIRLNVLDPIVDRFVLVEATKTHSNENKPLYFQLNKSRYEKFLHKIIHIVVDSYPPYETSWTYENYQRNAIMLGLKDCVNSDIIMLSDLDEIPNPETVIKVMHMKGIKCLCLDMYEYYLNNFNYRRPVWTYNGTKVFYFETFLKPLDEKFVVYNEVLIESMNITTTPTKIRLYNKCKYILNGGWHFSFLGGDEMIRYKLRSFSHQEFRELSNTSLHELQVLIDKGENIISGKREHVLVKIDNNFPVHIQNNRHSLSHLVNSEPMRNPTIVRVIRVIAPSWIKLKVTLRWVKYITRRIPG